LQDARQQAAAARSDAAVPMLDLAIARIHRLRKESDRAQEAIARSAQAYEVKRSEQGLAMVVAARGALAASTGDHTSPRVSFTRALALCEKAKDESHATCTKAVADDAIEAQQWPAAQKGLDRHLAALRAQDKAKSRTLELANAVEEIAVLAMLRGDRGGAAKRYQEALGLWQRLHADLAVARVLERMARLAWDRGDGILAAEWLMEALSVSRSFDNKGDTWARMRLLQAQIALKQKQRDQARTFATEAAALFDKLHSPEAATARAVLKKL
jgi:tetratricopeptide (TPR) repeat protein